MKPRLRAPSPALVVALIALFVALGGSSYAAITSLPKNSVGTKQLKKNAVTGVKIKNGAVTAGKINPAGLTVPNATSAATATNATELGGKAASAYASSTMEAPHVVGAASQPAYENNWGPPGFSGDEALSFFKDPWGIVHIQGNAGNSSGTNNLTIFTLPTGYRPAKYLYYAVYGSGGTAAYIQIAPSGTVTPFGPAQDYVGLTSITFKAGL